MVSRQDTATPGYYKELKLPCTRLFGGQEDEQRRGSECGLMNPEGVRYL